MSERHDYVLGTDDAEVARLALQHRVWRSAALDAWRRAGLASGATVVDLGCGPGDATLDLAAIVGPAGRVIAMDRSERFLEVVRTRARERNLSNISTFRVDLERDALPEVAADVVWNRWVLSFVREPRAVLSRLMRLLRPGGRFAILEYSDYAAWRMAPDLAAVGAFVASVMDAWRRSGGEPNLGLQLPGILRELGCDVGDVRGQLDLARRGDPKWDWLIAFFSSGDARLASLGVRSADESASFRDLIDALANDDEARMLTPAVIEIVATRP